MPDQCRAFSAQLTVVILGKGDTCWTEGGWHHRWYKPGPALEGTALEGTALEGRSSSDFGAVLVSIMNVR